MLQHLIMLIIIPYSVYHEVFSQSGELSGLLPGKVLPHKNHIGVTQLKAKWDPASDDCFIVGTCAQDDSKQVQ